MPSIVQFTHPGSEHGPDKRGGNHKGWNKKTHKRKFLEANGNCLTENGLESGKLLFWGEWEPPSYVKKLYQIDEDYPKYLHKPYLPGNLPEPSEQDPYQNTDPYVFDKYFRYFTCKQRAFNRLRRLDPGSIILFGATKGKKSSDALFNLDTIFVVKDRISYSPNSSSFPFEDENKDYTKLTLGMTHYLARDNKQKNGLYLGANPIEPFEEMYSYAPSRMASSEELRQGFPRVRLRNLKHITNNLNSAPKITDVSLKEAKDFFFEVRYKSREQGCLEGFNFKYYTEHTLI